MRSLASLVKRNLLLYLRDRGGVLLSLLASLILLLLYLLFLGELQLDSLQQSLPGVDAADVRAYIASWVLAGMVMITSFTTAVGALGIYADDRISGRFKEFRVSPIRRLSLALGYQISASIIAIGMTALIMILGAIILPVAYGVSPGWQDYLQAFGYVLLISLANSALLSFLVSFVNSESMYASLSTIFSTLLGFLAGAYLPLGVLSKPVGNVLNCLPFSPAAMLLRDPLAGDALNKLGPPGSMRDEIGRIYGHTIFVNDFQIEPLWVVGGLVIMFAVFSVLGAIRIAKTISR